MVYWGHSYILKRLVALLSQSNIRVHRAAQVVIITEDSARFQFAKTADGLEA